MINCFFSHQNLNICLVSSIQSPSLTVSLWDRKAKGGPRTLPMGRHNRGECQWVDVWHNLHFLCIHTHWAAWSVYDWCGLRGRIRVKRGEGEDPVNETDSGADSDRQGRTMTPHPPKTQCWAVSHAQLSPRPPNRTHIHQQCLCLSLCGTMVECHTCLGQN